MTSPAFYAAYANILVSHQLQETLRREPESLRSLYGLTADELVLLSSASPRSLHLSLHMLQAKRVVLLEQMLPQTLKLLQEHDAGRTLFEYVADAMRRPDVDMLRAVTHGHDFVAWLDRRVGWLPAGVADLARLEVAVAGLPPVSTAEGCEEHPAAEALGTKVFPELLPGLCVITVGCDILGLPARPSLADLSSIEQRPGGVLLRRDARSGRPACHRLGVITARLLSRCDGRSSLDAVVAVAGSTPSARRDAREVLHRAAQQSLIRLLPAPLGVPVLDQP
ncbi:hypothetical protein DFJ67_5746 [Asanoa ferruginea]|uniref:Uncharacterized protein n=1 Tax=Asanoa ferruginea TaxID=53367 RepID=A0A3D9ZQR6_9ACTN|nr:hypothetical protein [Asanoa ferruginea]REF99706.1 hypothetical protein DFJ67_5746 [Asanoa ferruginea]GIF50416.1 hypothetical protein Afe04nite_49550 [Asanoa ferruginea]